MSETRVAGFIDKAKTKQLQRHVPPSKHGEFVVVDLKTRSISSLTKAEAKSAFAELTQQNNFWTERFFK